MLIVLVISLYSSRIILQILGVEDFGIYNVVGGFVAMFSFLNTSMTNSIQRYYNFSLGKKECFSISEVYSCAVIIQIILAIVIVILTETIGIWYMNTKMIIPPERFNAAFWVFHLSVISLVIVVIQVPFVSAVMAYEKMNFFAIVSVIDAVLKLCIVLLLPYLPGDRLIMYGLIMLLITIFDFFLYFIYSKRLFERLRFRKTNLSAGLFRNILSFSAWNMFGTFAQICKDQGLNMILNLFFGPVVNAARGIAFQVKNAIDGFSANISTAARPQFTQSYAQGDVGRTIFLMFSISKLCYITLFALSLPLMIEVDYVLHLWLGDIVPEYTSIFVILICASTLISIFNPQMSYVVHATGNMKLYQTVGSIVDLLVLPVAYLFLKLGYSPESVFVVSMVFVFIKQIVCLLIVRHLVTFSIKNYCIGVVIPLLLMSLMTFAAVIGIHTLLQTGFARLIVVVLSSTVCIVVLSYLMVLNSREKEIVLEFVRKKLQRK